MMGTIRINIDWCEHNYCAAPENQDIACICTAKTFDKVQKEMEEALKEHIEWMKQDGDAVPAEFEGQWAFEWHLTTAALLHYTEKMIPKSSLAKVTGINQQQLTHYANGYRVPRPTMRQRIVNGLHAIAEKVLSIS